MSLKEFAKRLETQACLMKGAGHNAFLVAPYDSRTDGLPMATCTKCGLKFDWSKEVAPCPNPKSKGKLK